MTRKTPPSAVCPVCGRLMLAQALPGHVGSHDCTHRLQHERRGQHFDPDRGPLAFAAARALAQALRHEAAP